MPPAEAAKRAQEIGASEKPARSERGVNPFPVIFIVIIFFVIIGSIASRAGGRRYRSRARRHQPVGHPVGPQRDQPRLARRRRLGRRRLGGGGGGGGGGGFSGGGGSFGGGGASGGW